MRLWTCAPSLLALTATLASCQPSGVAEAPDPSPAPTVEAATESTPLAFRGYAKFKRLESPRVATLGVPVTLQLRLIWNDGCTEPTTLLSYVSSTYHQISLSAMVGTSSAGCPMMLTEYLATLSFTPSSTGTYTIVCPEGGSTDSLEVVADPLLMGL